MADKRISKPASTVEVFPFSGEPKPKGLLHARSGAERRDTVDGVGRMREPMTSLSMLRRRSFSIKSAGPGSQAVNSPLRIAFLVCSGIICTEANAF